MDNLLAALACAVCGRLCPSPVTLSCGQTVCRECLPPPTTEKRQVSDKVESPLPTILSSTFTSSSSSSESSLTLPTSCPDRAFPAASPSTHFTCPTKPCTKPRHAYADCCVDVTVQKLTDVMRICLQNDVVSEQDDTITTQSSIDTNLFLADVECQVCYLLFYQPITTPCGHTFCKSCLLRSIDHNSACPLCRHALPGYPFFHNHALNHAIDTFIQHAFPTLVTERSRINEQEKLVNVEPIFVCSLVFPKMPCFLHVFEPRYRLMMRRCTESKRRRFGMCLPALPSDAPFQDYGTMVEICGVEMLPDGRSLVETVGSHRFKVLSRGVVDGYNTAQIERWEDVDPDEEERLEAEDLQKDEHLGVDEEGRVQTNAEMVAKCASFIHELSHASAPWLMRRLSATYGAMPDPEQHVDFSWWVASVIPVEDYEKYRLLETRSVRDRLKMLCAWIDALNDQRWFARGGCMVQ